MTVPQIIRLLGGAAVVAAQLGLPGNDVGGRRVRAWAMRSSVPGEYWLALVAFSERAGKGVTLEDLARAHDKAGAGNG